MEMLSRQDSKTLMHSCYFGVLRTCALALQARKVSSNLSTLSRSRKEWLEVVLGRWLAP